MAITESRKQSDLEKRLQILRQQVYGKRSNQSLASLPVRGYQSKGLDSDITYLRYDLVKILILSTLAIGIQLILFIFFERR